MATTSGGLSRGNRKAISHTVLVRKELRHSACVSGYSSVARAHGIYSRTQGHKLQGRSRVDSTQHPPAYLCAPWSTRVRSGARLDTPQCPELSPSSTGRGTESNDGKCSGIPRRKSMPAQVQGKRAAPQGSCTTRHPPPGAPRPGLRGAHAVCTFTMVPFRRWGSTTKCGAV